MSKLPVVTSRAPFSYWYAANGEILVPNVGGIATTLDTVVFPDLRMYNKTGGVCFGIDTMELRILHVNKKQE